MHLFGSKMKYFKVRALNADMLSAVLSKTNGWRLVKWSLGEFATMNCLDYWVNHIYCVAERNFDPESEEYKNICLVSTAPAPRHPEGYVMFTVADALQEIEFRREKRRLQRKARLLGKSTKKSASHRKKTESGSGSDSTSDSNWTTASSGSESDGDDEEDEEDEEEEDEDVEEEDEEDEEDAASTTTALVDSNSTADKSKGAAKKSQALAKPASRARTDVPDRGEGTAKKQKVVKSSTSAPKARRSPEASGSGSKSSESGKTDSGAPTSQQLAAMEDEAQGGLEAAQSQLSELKDQLVRLKKKIGKSSDPDKGKTLKTQAKGLQVKISEIEAVISDHEKMLRRVHGWQEHIRRSKSS